jgi:polyferredoxin
VRIILTNENRIAWHDETDSSEGPRDQLCADVRKANAQIQSRSYIGCFDCPDACDRLVYHGVFIKAFRVNTRADARPLMEKPRKNE